MPGAGKSTVAPLLAARPGWLCIDTDAAVVAAAGLSVAELFDRHGEAHFRSLERTAVAAALAGPGQVVAAGGGAFADPATQRLILKSATAIWLDADIPILAARLTGAVDRPLLRGKLTAALMGMLAERTPAYTKASIRICTDRLTPGDVTDAICARLFESEQFGPG